MRRLWAPEGAGLTAGHAFLLAFKHGNGDLLADLDFIRIGDIAGSGNVGIMIGRPIKAVAYLRQVVSLLTLYAWFGPPVVEISWCRSE